MLPHNGVPAWLFGVLMVLLLPWDVATDVETCVDAHWCRDIDLPELCGQIFDGNNISQTCPLECEACAAHASDVFVVVIMINTAPQDFTRREAMRKTLPGQYGDAHIVGTNGTRLRLKMTHFFAVGTPSHRWDAESKSNLTRAQLMTKLKSESHQHKDLAHVIIEDGVQMTLTERRQCKHCLPGDSGKSHHLFTWAYKRYKNRAHVIMKQDDDTFVDWAVAAPRLFNGLAVPPHNMVFGAKHHKEYEDNRYKGGCPAGALYGFSLDVAKAISENVQPRVHFEDLEACNWIVAVEDITGKKVGRTHLIPCSESKLHDYWVHGRQLKELSYYIRCQSPQGCHGKCNPKFIMTKFKKSKGVIPYQKKRGH